MPSQIVTVMKDIKRKEEGSKNFVKFEEMKKPEGVNRAALLIGNNGEPYVANELIAAAEKKLGKPVKAITITIEAFA